MTTGAESNAQADREWELAGVRREYHRCSAHLLLGETSGDLALSKRAIADGQEVTRTVLAQYVASAMKTRQKGRVESVLTLMGGDDAPRFKESETVEPPSGAHATAFRRGQDAERQRVLAHLKGLHPDTPEGRSTRAALKAIRTRQPISEEARALYFGEATAGPMLAAPAAESGGTASERGAR